MLALVLALSFVPCTQHKLLECLNLPVRVSITSGPASSVMLALVLALSLVPFGPVLSTLFLSRRPFPLSLGIFQNAVVLVEEPTRNLKNLHTEKNLLVILAYDNPHGTSRLA